MVVFSCHEKIIANFESLILADSSVSVFLKHPSRMQRKIALSKGTLCLKHLCTPSISHRPNQTNFSHTLIKRVDGLSKYSGGFPVLFKTNGSCFGSCLEG